MTAAEGPHRAGTVPVREALRGTVGELSGTGPGEPAVDSPRAEAETVWAHVLGTTRGGLPTARDATAAEVAEVRALVRRRLEGREPLQYLLGTAVSGHLDLAVGPGVFVPRPETELLAVDVVTHLPTVGAAGGPPVVVDLCAGSGTLALEIAHARPGARVHAVELYPQALQWLRRNAADRASAGDTLVEVHAADATDPALLTALRGSVDAVVSNPPYVPGEPSRPAAEDALDALPPELAHEPRTALFAGPDGLDVIRPMVHVAAALVAPGGRLVVEHDDSTQEAVAAVLEDSGAFGTVERHADLAGRPRFVSAIRRGGPGDQDRKENAR